MVVYHTNVIALGAHVSILRYWEFFFIRGLPLIMYAARGGGGVNTNAYKCVLGGEGGSEHDQKYAFCTQMY